MANEEQLSILKQGAEVWNRWRQENPETEINLRDINLDKTHLQGARLQEADLARASLAQADLSGAHLLRARLVGTRLSRANLRGANLTGADVLAADLSGSDLEGANLRGAFLTATNCAGANLRGADLEGTRLSKTNLSGANLAETELFRANFWRAILTHSNFQAAIAGDTIFADIDLSEVTGLDSVRHREPSTIGINTALKSKGLISEVFLRGCGLPDWEIESMKLHDPDSGNERLNETLYRVYELRATRAIQISPLFVSYSHADREFVDKIGNSLNEIGVRYWRDIHDMRAGRMEKQIDRAIELNPTVLLVLSKHSLQSDWAQHEVRKARTLEQKLKRDVLCPVALDDSWKSSRWPARIMEQIMEYNILDFSDWNDDHKFNDMFRRLIDGLELFYKG